MGREIGLEHHLPARVAGTSQRHRIEQRMIGPLGRPEVRQVQAGIGMGNSDEPRATQGRPLEEHLGPDQDIQFVARCQPANRLGLGGRARDVPVQPADPGVGKQAPNLFLDPFGSEADRFNARTAAGGTSIRERARRTAIVTGQAGGPSIKRERHTAPLAAWRDATVPAE